jgi:disulfide bond formation protein DsbB
MVNPFRWPFRVQFAAGFLVCAALYAYALFEQFAGGYEPCPLCIFQRIAVMVVGIFFLVGAIHNPGPTGRRVEGLLVLLAAATGASIAIYHLWVQHQPPDPMASCTPGWNYMVENFPISKALKMAFTGHADCAEVNWTLLGLSMPFWTLTCFILLGAGGTWAAFRRRAAG